ncbi:MAG: TolC family protein [Chitinophagaceae bacterium]
MPKSLRYIALLSLFAISVVCKSQSNVPTLTELIDSALLYDYTLLNEKIDISQSELEKQQLQDAFLPRLSVNGANGFSINSLSIKTKEIVIPQLNIRIDEQRNRFTLTSVLSTFNADASMLLYSGGKIPLLKRAVEERIRAQGFLTLRQKEEIISDVINTYDQLALLKQARIVLNESEKRLAANLKISDKSFSYGLITEYERQKIEVAQAQLASKITDYDGKLTLVLEKLFWLTHIPIERLKLISNTLEPMDSGLDHHTIENRPELKASEAIIAAQQYKIKAEKTWRIPKIQAAASAGYVGSFFGHLSSSRSILPNGDKLSSSLNSLFLAPTGRIGVGFSWNIFDGRDGKRGIQKAKLELSTAENNKADLLQKLHLNLTRSKTEFAVALTQVTTGTKQREITKNALVQATREFRTGLIRSSQLIEAEEDFQQADLGLLQAIYDQRRTAVELLKATGSLTIQSFR